MYIMMSPYTHPLCDPVNLRLIRDIMTCLESQSNILHSYPKNGTDDRHGRVVWGGAEFLSHEISDIALN